MPIRLAAALAGLAFVAGAAAPLRAQAPAPAPTASLAGDGTYRLYCATCHGRDARGDGPLASSLRRRPPDLTRLAAVNGGTFPAEMVARVIDGRRPLKGHGGGEMPVWGDAFANSSERTAPEERIARLVAFIEKLQTGR